MEEQYCPADDQNTRRTLGHGGQEVMAVASPRGQEGVFVTIRQAQQITLEFSSSLPHVDQATRACLSFAQQVGTGCPLFDLELVLREGLTNAAKHGNRLHPARRVQCMMEVSPQALRITIADEGEGFAWKAQQEHIAEVDIPSGRGLWLMQLYGFDVTYNARGNVLILTRPRAIPTQGDRQ